MCLQVNTCVPYPCRGSNCVGGIARVATAMEALRRRYPQSILLNAGDNFQVDSPPAPNPLGPALKGG